MKKSLFVAILLGATFLSGCAGLGSSMPGADLFAKGNSTTVTLEGKGSVKHAVDLFRKVTRADGGFVSSYGEDSATALFRDKKVDLQMTAEKIGNGTVRVVIQSASETNVSRIYEFGDAMLDIPVKVAGDMTGFAIVDKRRAR